LRLSLSALSRLRARYCSPGIQMSIMRRPSPPSSPSSVMTYVIIHGVGENYDSILLADNNKVFAVASERSMEYDFHMAKEASVCRHFSPKAQAMGSSGNIW
jgi:hypothetical protein